MAFTGSLAGSGGETCGERGLSAGGLNPAFAKSCCAAGAKSCERVFRGSAGGVSSSVGIIYKGL